MRQFGTTGRLLVFLILMFASTSMAFDFSQIESKVVDFKLDNGLRFLVLPRHDAPVATFVTLVNAGCADDPKGYMGMAHMFEHMAFKGTVEIGSKDIKKENFWMAKEDSLFELILNERAKGYLADSARLVDLGAQMAEATDSGFQYSETNAFGQIVDRNGGSDLNAGTSFDYTIYYVNYPSNRLELWMAMEADRFSNPVLRELFKEKQVVAEERRFRVESAPTGRLVNEYLGLAYNSHPYGQPMIGEMSEIQNYNRPVMMKQFNMYYIPSNIVIAIVGDVDPGQVKKLAEKYFGKIKARPKQRDVMIDEPEPFGNREVTISENSQPMMITGFHVPSQRHPDWIALDAISSYLGSGRTSVLYKKLVKEKKSAVQVAAFVGYPGSKYPSMLSILSVPSNESTNKDNEAVILEEIEKLRTELIPVEELDKIKAQAKSELINGLASNSGLAIQLASYQTMQDDWHRLFKLLDRVNSLTPEEIQRVANKYMDTTKRVTAYLEKPEA
nr:insulinase family protein [candidate division Zixibacteria bacterium]